MVFSFHTSNLSDAFPGVLPKYFSSEWSFAQFHLPEDTQFIAAFGSQNTVIIVGMDGRYVTVLFSFLLYWGCILMFLCSLREHNFSSVSCFLLMAY